MNGIERLCKAIEYPDDVPAGAMSFSLRVDGGNIRARIRGRRLVLTWIIDRVENDIVQLSKYATGRILIENAVLAWDRDEKACILWQDIAENAESDALIEFFEAFMASVDWWVARAGELNAPPVVFPDIIIRP